MGKEFNTRASKKQALVKEGATTMENKTPQPPPEIIDSEKNNPTESHEAFIKNGVKPADQVKPVDLSPELEKAPLGSVYDSPTVENEYIAKGRGINNPPPPPNNTGTSGASTTPPPPIDNTGATNQGAPPPPFEATPPPPDSAPEADTQPPPAGASADQPFTMPAGTAEETVQWGFEMLNYGIKNFGGILTDVRVGKQHLVKLPANMIDPMTNLINDKNEKNRTKLTFSQEEITMLKKPIARGLVQAGIRGMTWKEELAIVGAAILVKKIKDVQGMRQENKVLETKIAQLIAEHFDKTSKGKKKEPEDVTDITSEPVE